MNICFLSPTFSGTLSGFSKPFCNNVSLRPNWQFPQMMRKMKSKVEGEKGNPTHLQSAVSLRQPLKLLSEILPMGERASSQKREGRCMRDKSFFYGWTSKCGQAIQGIRLAVGPESSPEISALSQGTPRQAQHPDKCLLRPAAENCWQLAG